VAFLGGLPTSPIVVGGSVFVEDQAGEVDRLDLSSGEVAWKSPAYGFSVGPNGVAVGWGKVFATNSSSLFALDEQNGHLLWTTRLTHTSTDGVDIQPQVVGRAVIAASVPVSLHVYQGGDRGFIDAVSEQNGRLLWGFDTVASPTLWGNPTINSGGGSWFPPTYSPRTGLLYVGVANPAPFVGVPGFPNGTSRPGSNLYTDATVALRLSSGRLAWYRQADPHDLFDRDFVHTMLVSVPSQGSRPPRAVVVGTGKGGFVLGMDPSSGKLLWRTAVGLHLNDNLTALSGPTEVLPGTFGGVLTPPASAHGRVFVAALNAPDILSPEQTAYFGGKTGTMPGDVVAIDARTGKRIWDTKVPGDPTGGVTLVNNLVLTATLQGSVYALSMASGRVLWRTQAAGGINGWMSVAGQTLIIPVGLAKPPVLWALRLPKSAPK
jgi:outer membrane protein assembly factor BamB